MEQKLSAGKKVLSVNLPDLCRNNTQITPLSPCSDWMFVCSTAGSFYIRIIFHSFITVTIHLAWGKKQRWLDRGHLVTFPARIRCGENLLQSHLIQPSYQWCVAAIESLPCHPQTQNSHNKRHIHLLLYREKTGRPITIIYLRPRWQFSYSHWHINSLCVMNQRMIVLLCGL